MSKTKVKTTYSVQGSFASTEIRVLYCEHNHSTDYTTFYNEDGSIVQMCFDEWKTGDDLWDAMLRLDSPFKDKWGDELKDRVEYYFKDPWESQNNEKEQPSGKLTFNVNYEKDPIIKLCANGDIYVKGKLIENDLELVEGMREFLKRAKL